MGDSAQKCSPSQITDRKLLNPVSKSAVRMSIRVGDHYKCFFHFSAAHVYFPRRPPLVGTWMASTAGSRMGDSSGRMGATAVAAAVGATAAPATKIHLRWFYTTVSMCILGFLLFSNAAAPNAQFFRQRKIV